MSITSLKNANNDLILSALDVAVLLAPYTTAMPTTLEDPSTGDLIALPGFRSVGSLEKSSGVNFGISSTSKDIESYGEAEPTKKLISKRGFEVDFVMQESNRQALELWNAADYSAITPSAHGGIVLPTPGRPQVVYYRAVLVAEDGAEGSEINPYWLLPKVALTNTANQSLSDDGVITYHPTLTAFKDKTFLGGTAVAQGFCGPGWQSLAAAAGFGTTTTKTFTLPGGTTGGTWTVTIDGKTSNLLSNLVTRGSFESTLEALVGEGNVTVTGTDGLSGYTAVFRTPVTTVTASGASLTPSGTVTVA